MERTDKGSQGLEVTERTDKGQMIIIGDESERVRPSAEKKLKAEMTSVKGRLRVEFVSVVVLRTASASADSNSRVALAAFLSSELVARGSRGFFFGSQLVFNLVHSSDDAAIGFLMSKRQVVVCKRLVAAKMCSQRLWRLHADNMLQIGALCKVSAKPRAHLSSVIKRRVDRIWEDFACMLGDQGRRQLTLYAKLKSH